MAAASVISTGTVSASASSVANPTNLTPGLPGTRQNEDMLLCFTTCRSATPTVATPSGWTSVLNLTGTNGRIVIFARIVDGSESAPTVTWSGLTTGTSGTTVQAVIACVRGLMRDASNAPVVDVTGTVSNQAASTTAAAGGNGITTTGTDSFVLVLSDRLDDAGTWSTLTISDGVTWAKVSATQASTSGADHAQEWQYGTKATAGAIAAKTFTLIGASSFASSGVMIALKTATALGDTMQAVWNTRAVLGDSSQEVWNTRQAVGDPGQLVWNTRAAAGDIADLRWAARTVVGDQAQLLWSVLVAGTTAVGDDLAVVWNTRAALGDTSQTVWNTRALAADQAQLVWHARAVLADAAQLVWNLRTALGKASDTRWAVRSLSGDQAALSWAVRALAADASSLRWNTRLLAADALDVRWRALTTLGDTLDARWAVLALAGDQPALVWAVRASVGDTATLVWDTLGLALAGRDLQIIWQLRSRATGTLRARWRTESYLGPAVFHPPRPTSVTPAASRGGAHVAAGAAQAILTASRTTTEV